MTQASSAEWEVAIALPLGAVASQLRRIEAQLRLLNMKALDLARHRDNRALQTQAEARIEEIRETLGSVAGLVSDIEADIVPESGKLPRLSVDEEAASRTDHNSANDPRPTRGSGGSVHRSSKPYPERDD